MRISIISVTLTSMLAVSLPAAAQVCESGDVQESLQYLRRLSLDLRGQLPSVEELESVVSNGTVDPAIIASMLDAETFVEQMRRYHLDLLWTNVRNQRLTNQAWVLVGPGGRGNQFAYYSPSNLRMNTYRGGQGPCLDEPARFDERTGEILTTPDANNPNIRREGWVEVAPYWNPSVRVRVCAFDAQDNLQGTDARGNAVECARTVNTRNCGCGPNLQWCQSIPDLTEPRITTSMNEQLLRYIDGIVRDGRPYTDVILGKDMELNGPLAFWLRYQTGQGGAILPAISDQNHPLPDLGFEEDARWETVQRGTRHAGVLSMPGYLIKFASDRGRANRFYNAFLCQHFESNEAIPPATDDCHAEPDLTKRCGCKGCHLTVEPAAAYWGRWAEAALLPLEEPLFPKMDPTCARSGRGVDRCSLFYFTERDVQDPDVEQQYVGMLRAYVFADATREANIEVGPEGLARTAVESGAFARCTTQQMWNLFMGREARDDEAETMAELTSAFTADYDLELLVERIVTRPEYVRGGRFGGEE